MNPHWLKFAGIALTTIGSLMFTIRATRILSALSLAAKAHENNIQNLLPTNRGDILILGNSTAHVQRAQSKVLLILGIFLIAAGLTCQAGSAYLDAAQQAHTTKTISK